MKEGRREWEKRLISRSSFPHSKDDLEEGEEESPSNEPQITHFVTKQPRLEAGRRTKEASDRADDEEASPPPNPI